MRCPRPPAERRVDGSGFQIEQRSYCRNRPRCEAHIGDPLQVSYTCWGEDPAKAAVLGEELESVEAKRLHIPARAPEGLEVGPRLGSASA